MNSGFTPFDNNVLEKLCKTPLTQYQFRIALAIIRKTTGYQDPKTGRRKKFDRIAVSQLVTLTEIDRRNISKVILQLIKLNVICRDDKRIGLSPNFSMPSGEMTESILTDDKLSSGETHTKDIKEEIIKEINKGDPNEKLTRREKVFATMEETMRRIREKTSN